MIQGTGLRDEAGYIGSLKARLRVGFGVVINGELWEVLELRYGIWERADSY